VAEALARLGPEWTAADRALAVPRQPGQAELTGTPTMPTTTLLQSFAYRQLRGKLEDDGYPDFDLADASSCAPNAKFKIISEVR